MCGHVYHYVQSSNDVMGGYTAASGTVVSGNRIAPTQPSLTAYIETSELIRCWDTRHRLPAFVVGFELMHQTKGVTKRETQQAK